MRANNGMNKQVIARFERCEITCNAYLGSGGFSDVFEISRFNLINEKAATQDKGEVATRHLLASRARRQGKGDGRFAIKIPKCLEEASAKTVQETMDHFINEVRVLRLLDHPNILKMRGLVSSDDLDCYCIITDRLEENLDDRIIRWKEQEKKMKGGLRKLRDRKGDKRREFLVRRLTVAFGVARALAYLHEENMIYRDVKPANVGFDANDQTILFDMGLCREMPDKDLNEKFEMSGKGTVRYMSPEVRRHQRYNEKADVYSFTHVMWEILALEKPYSGFTCEMHANRVVRLGERPTVDTDAWPAKICNLLELGWHADPKRRTTMKVIQRTLEDVIAGMSGQRDSLHSVLPAGSDSRIKPIKMASRMTSALPLRAT